MKVGDVHHSSRKTVSFSTQDPIGKQLDNLSSMVSNMSMQKEIIGHLSPKYIKREREARTNKISQRQRQKQII